MVRSKSCYLSPTDSIPGYAARYKVMRQEPAHIASVKDFVRVKEKARIMRDNYMHYEEYAQIMPTIIASAKGRPGETNSADEEDQVEDGVTPGPADEPNPTQHQERMSVGQSVDLTEPSEPRLSMGDRVRRDDQSVMLGALAHGLLDPGATSSPARHASACRDRCISCDQVQPNIPQDIEMTDVNRAEDVAFVLEPGRPVPDLRGVGIPRHSRFHDTYIPDDGQVHRPNSIAPPPSPSRSPSPSPSPGFRSLGHISQFSQRVSDLGLTREATQRTFRDMRSEPGLAPALAVNPPPQPLADVSSSLGWNNARAKLSQTTRATTSNKVAPDSTSALGIFNVAEREARATSPASLFRATSNVALPEVSTDDSGDAYSDELASSDDEDDYDVEEEELDEDEDNGILSGGEGRPGTPLSVKLCDSDDGTEHSFGHESNDNETTASHSASESEAEINAASVPHRTIRQLNDLPPAANDAGLQTKLTPNNALGAVPTGRNNLREPHIIARPKQNFQPSLIAGKDSGTDENSRQSPCAHDAESGVRFPCPTCDRRNSAPFRPGPRHLSNKFTGPTFRRDGTHEEIRKRSLPRGFAHDAQQQSEVDSMSTRAVMSTSPMFRHVREASTDAEFYLAWVAALEDLKRHYPKSKEPTYDNISSAYYARFVKMDTAKTENTTKMWTVDKARREVDEQLRRKRLREKQNNQLPLMQDSKIVSADVSDPSPSLKEAQFPEISIIDDSWMEDSTGVLGVGPVSKKASGKRKKKQQRRKAKKPVEQHSITGAARQSIREDSESEASDVDISALVATKLAKEEVDSPASAPADNRRSEPACGEKDSPKADNSQPQAESIPTRTLERIHITPLIPEVTSQSLGQAQRTPAATPQPSSNPGDDKHETGTSHNHLPTGERDGPAFTVVKFDRESVSVYQRSRESTTSCRSPSGPAKQSVSRLHVDRGISSIPLAQSDLQEGAFISRHPQTGEEIVVFPGPRPRPPYERSLFVTGIRKNSSLDPGTMRRILRDHFSAFYPVERINLVSDATAAIYNAFISIDTREHALSLIDNPQARILLYNTGTIGEWAGDEVKDELKIEMAQGTRPLYIKLNKSSGLRNGFHPLSRMGRPVGDKVVYERYLEYAGSDERRKKYRIRHRIDLSANTLCPDEYERERSIRSFYGNDVATLEPLVLDVKSAASDEAAVRLLCEPFGDIEAMTPSMSSRGDQGGFNVKYWDRDGSLRASQQLRLLNGVVCYVPKPDTATSARTDMSLQRVLTNQSQGPNDPRNGIRSSSVECAKVEPTSRNGTEQHAPQSTIALAEEWPALPSAKRSDGLASLSTSSAEKDPTTSPVGHLTENRHGKEVKMLSPVEEEPVEASDSFEETASRTLRRDQELAGTTVVDSPPQSPEALSASAKSGSKPSLGLKTPENIPRPVDIAVSPSAIGLIHTPALNSKGEEMSSIPVVDPSLAHRPTPVVALGSSEQSKTSDSLGPAAKRMSLEISNLSNDDTEDTVRERFKPYGRVTAVKIFEEGSGLPRRATVSFTSVASARHAASQENCPIVGEEQRPTVPSSKRIGKTDEIQADKGEGPPEPDSLTTLCGSHSEPQIFALKQDASHELLKVETNDTKTGRKRSRSDPGRDTPVAMEAEAILSDDSKSDTALEEAGAHEEERNPSVVMIEHEARAYPSIRGISEMIGQDYRHPASQVSADILHHDEMARRLSEANMMLAQWHTWAVRNGLPVPPHSGFPPVHSTVQQPQCDPLHQRHHIASPFESQNIDMPYRHLKWESEADHHRQRIALPPQGVSFAERNLGPSRGLDSQLQQSPDSYQVEIPQIYPEAPASEDSPGGQHPHSVGGKLQPVRVIDTPQGLYALYDRAELLEYKKTIPHEEVPEEEYLQAESNTLYPIWSGGHPPEKHTQWQTATSEAQYRQSFETEDGSNQRTETALLPPTPQSSRLEEFDHGLNYRSYLDGRFERGMRSEGLPYQTPQHGRESPFIHHPMPLPRPQAFEPRFNMYTSTPTPREFATAHAQYNDTTVMGTVASTTNGLHQPHRYTTSVRVPDLRQQPGTDHAHNSYYSGSAYGQRFGTSTGYRGSGGHRRGFGKRGSQTYETHQYRNVNQ